MRESEVDGWLRTLVWLAHSKCRLCPLERSHTCQARPETLPLYGVRMRRSVRGVPRPVVLFIYGSKDQPFSLRQFCLSCDIHTGRVSRSTFPRFQMTSVYAYGWSDFRPCTVIDVNNAIPLIAMVIGPSGPRFVCRTAGRSLPPVHKPRIAEETGSLPGHPVRLVLPLGVILH